MNSRERILTSIAHREPDRVPFNARLGEEQTAAFHKEHGEGDYAEFFHHDIRYVYWNAPKKPEDVPEMDWTPEPNAPAIANIRASVNDLHRRELAACGGYACGIYEQAKAWLGDEATMVAPYEQPASFGKLLEKITAWKSSVYGAYAQAGADVVWIGDDLGTQRSLVMSPSLYREWYKPHHQHLVNHLRSLHRDVKIAFHCCGHVTPLIPDLIEIGIDILEAVQAEAMDIAGLKREFGKDITFWGGVGAQSVLQGSPKQVEEGVKKTLRIMSAGGGYIAAPCHTLTEEVAWENVAAFYRAMNRFGAYPHPGEGP